MLDTRDRVLRGAAAPRPPRSILDMAGNVSRDGTTVTGCALALIGACDEQHRRRNRAGERADLPVPTEHRLVGELVA